MGNWCMVIQGVGVHHNGLALDADALLRDFVAELKACGHTIRDASLTHGGAEIVPPMPSLVGALEEIDARERAALADVNVVPPGHYSGPELARQIGDPLLVVRAAPPALEEPPADPAGA
jgi:hypothetical protein